MTGWVSVLVAAALVVMVCGVGLLGIGVVGSYRDVQTGPLVVVGRVLFVILLVAVAVVLGAALWGGVSAVVGA